MSGKAALVKMLTLNLMVLMIAAGCATAPKKPKQELPSFRDYQPKNAQETEVFNVLVDLGQLWRKADSAEELLPFFDENVVMVTDYPIYSFKPGRIVGIKANMSHWQEQHKNWNSVGSKIYLPLHFDVKGDMASVVYPYKFWIYEWLYWEIGRVHLTLQKKDGKWVVTQWLWDLIDTNARNYDPKLWEREKPKFLPAKWIDNQYHPASRQAGPD